MNPITCESSEVLFYKTGYCYAKSHLLAALLRANKNGVNAKLTPPKEQLAFLINTKQEADLPEIWSTPLPMVISVLKKSKTYKEVYASLPDIESNL